MLKFVVLSVLALGCYSQTFQPKSYSYQSGGYGSGYGAGYTGGYSSVQPSQYSFAGRSFGGAGAGQNSIGFGQYGAGLGFYGYQPVVASSGASRFGGISSQGIQYRQVAAAAAQPVATAFIAQPVGVQSGFNAINVAAAQPIATGRVAHIAEAKPAISFLHQHHSEPYQEVIQAAVQQVGRTVEYKAMPHQDQPLQPQVVEVEPSETPLHIHFKTKSSSVSLSQSHQQQAPQEAQLAQTQDEPSRVMHEIQKPIIQEVREVITPYRQVTQEIHPVVEAVHTVVTKAEGQRQQYAAPHYQPSTGAAAVQQFSAVAAAQPQSIAVARPIATSAIQYQPAQSIAVAAEPVSVGYQTVAAAQPISSFQAVAAQPASAFQVAAAQPVASYAVQPASSSFGAIQTSSVQPIQSYKFEIPSTSGYESSGASFVVGQPITTTSSFSSNSGSGSFVGQPLSTSSIRSGSIESRNY